MMLKSTMATLVAVGIAFGTAGTAVAQEAPPEVNVTTELPTSTDEVAPADTNEAQNFYRGDYGIYTAVNGPANTQAALMDRDGAFFSKATSHIYLQWIADKSADFDDSLAVKEQFSTLTPESEDGEIIDAYRTTVEMLKGINRAQTVDLVESIGGHFIPATASLEIAPTRDDYYAKIKEVGIVRGGVEDKKLTLQIAKLSKMIDQGGILIMGTEDVNGVPTLKEDLSDLRADIIATISR